MRGTGTADFSDLPRPGSPKVSIPSRVSNAMKPNTDPNPHDDNELKSSTDVSGILGIVDWVSSSKLIRRSSCPHAY